VSTLNSKKYKEAERQSWDSVANNWQKWWKTIEIGAEKVGRRLIELAEIKPGSRVLDIATGIGEPAITAADQVGNNGHISHRYFSTDAICCKTKSYLLRLTKCD
jgi:ubiquinone/menaquinone biosynthesis C-methylase UbiE